MFIDEINFQLFQMSLSPFGIQDHWTFRPQYLVSAALQLQSVMLESVFLGKRNKKSANLLKICLQVMEECMLTFP